MRNSRYGNPVERISYIENGVKEERGKRREEKKIIMMTNPEGGENGGRCCEGDTYVRTPEFSWLIWLWGGLRNAD